MKSEKTKIFIFFLLGSLIGILGAYVFNNYKIEKKEMPASTVENTSERKSEEKTEAAEWKADNSNVEIDELTSAERVVRFVKENGRLPEYYITKGEARSKGWVASEGNLCDVLPGRAIGGDRFSNREKQLPKGQNYFEADINYNCGRRGAHRIVYTEEGDVWLTLDHYKTFEKQ